MEKRVFRMKKEGFTLIELLIVLTIGGVILAVTTPSMLYAYRQLETKAAVNRFIVAHSLARLMAVRYGRVGELHIDAANARFWIEVDTSGSGIRDTVGLLHDLSEAVTMTSDRSRLCFEARGLTTTRNQCEPGDVTVQFAMAGHVETVETTVLGKVIR